MDNQSGEEQKTSTKYCSGCKKQINLEFFKSSKRTSDGYASKCNNCAEKARQVYHNNLDRAKEILENDEKCKTLTNIQPIIFCATCSVCENDYDERENNLGLEPDICKECNIKGLVQTDCYKGQRKLCVNKRCLVCYAKSFACHEKAVCWSNKNTEIPRGIFKSFGKKYIFKCSDCNHEFECTLNNISGGKWCPFCVNKKLCKNSTCQLCYNKSFASINHSIHWSNKNVETPREVFKNSSKKYFFLCPKCNHNFDSTLGHVSGGKWCPFCVNKRLCGDSTCQLCYKKSFASSNQSIYWSDKNKATPREIFKYTHEKYLFVCPTCKHNFDSPLNNIMAGNWCPFCSSPPKKLCDNPDCSHCYIKSFASCKRFVYWSDKNKEKPREVFKNSSKKFFFVCPDCSHEFCASLLHISNGRWCPKCKIKTQRRVYSYLLEIIKLLIFIFNSSDIQIKWEFKADWCRNIKNNRYLPLDIAIIINDIPKIIIEIDGKQHFEYVSRFNNDVSKNIDRDIYKMNKAIENNCFVIRLVQEEIWNNKYDWKIKLLDIIKEISNIIEPQKYFIALDNNIYSLHKE